MVSKPSCLRFITFFLLPSHPGEGDIDGKGIFSRQGRKDLEALRYSEAVSNLSLAQREFPLLEDYTLYYLAEAYHGFGRSSEIAGDEYNSLLYRYPQTPLRKKARMIEIQEKKDAGSGDLLPLLRSVYKKTIRTMKRCTSSMRNCSGKTGKIRQRHLSVFKKIYVNCR